MQFAKKIRVKKFRPKSLNPPYRSFFHNCNFIQLKSEQTSTDIFSNDSTKKAGAIETTQLFNLHYR